MVCFKFPDGDFQILSVFPASVSVFKMTNPFKNIDLMEIQRFVFFGLQFVQGWESVTFESVSAYTIDHLFICDRP